ncbi:RHS repeat-associated core domain-containing protein [Pseudomonas sp. TE50-2]|uniref:RHS repeat-associated core domain-containing protein n=1 Tax=Pseudomonas sp. TE50-2 TaxID=3142707 RepID=UPI003465929E
MSSLLICDRQQSVLAVRETVRSYTAYGALSAVAGPRMAYCGQLREPFKGIYHLGNGHRCFDPALMRFLSPDALSPFGAGGVNAYAYCQGEPINSQDNSGRMGVSSILQTGYVAWKGSMLNKHVSALAEMRKNGAGRLQQSAVVVAIVLNGVDITAKGVKDYFGLSLHSNQEMMMADDPLFSKLGGIDIGISVFSVISDFIAYAVSRSCKHKNATQVRNPTGSEGGRLEAVALHKEPGEIVGLVREETV